MTIFDTYDKIIENIQQIPLDVYLFERRNRRLKSKVEKTEKKLKHLTKTAYRGKHVDYEIYKKLCKKLCKIKNKFAKSSKILHNVLLSIFDRTNYTVNTELGDIEMPKLSIDNINRIVKLRKTKTDRGYFCTCRQKASGNMIACDNIKCSVKWFHFECIGITMPPKNIWLCSDCKKLKD